MEKLIELSKSGSIYLLNQLVDEGLIDIIGRGKATKYRLK